MPNNGLQKMEPMCDIAMAAGYTSLDIVMHQPNLKKNQNKFVSSNWMMVILILKKYCQD